MLHLKKSKLNKNKKARQALKQYNDSDRSVMLRKAQKVVNEYIRIRDGKKCISCGYEGDGRQFHAGHYRSQGGNSALRFNEDNIHSQCSICNTHLSGNLAEYRKNLILKIGNEKVEWLESTNNIKKWSVEELHEIIRSTKQKIKELQAIL
jgi:hypothetical protein